PAPSRSGTPAPTTSPSTTGASTTITTRSSTGTTTCRATAPRSSCGPRTTSPSSGGGSPRSSGTPLTAVAQPAQPGAERGTRGRRPARDGADPAVVSGLFAGRATGRVGAQQIVAAVAAGVVPEHAGPDQLRERGPCLVVRNTRQVGG